MRAIVAAVLTRFATIRARVIGLLIVGVLGTATLLTTFGIQQATRNGHRIRSDVNGLTANQLDLLAKGLANVVTTQGDTTAATVKRDIQVADYVLKQDGGLSLGTASVQWQAKDQVSLKVLPVTLPQMLLAGKWLGKNKELALATPVVDEVKSLIGGTATIFQRMPDGSMLRVATNIKTKTNVRAIGTYIPFTTAGKPNPVLATVYQGKTYNGIAYVVDSYYQASYEPITNTAGAIIGMVYVGVKQAELPTLRTALLATKAGPHGQVHVLGTTGDRRGKLLVSEMPTDAQPLTVKDADGVAYFTAAVDIAATLAPGALASLHYRDTKTGTHTLRVSYYKPWDWTVIVDAQDSDFAQVGKRVDSGTATLGRSLLLAGLAAVLVMGAIAAVVGSRIARPLEKLRDRMVAVSSADADLRTRLDDSGRGEAGELARAFNAFVEKVADTVRGVGKVTERLRDTGASVSAMAADLSEAAARSAQRSSQSKAAAERVNGTVTDLTHGTQEMSQSIGEISRNAGQAATVADEAVRLVLDTAQAVNRLAESSAGIGEVVKVITSIAEQTNLLALNATIEAARAGDSGKGFAVVANEVKELARGTADATEDISHRVASIQAETGSVAQAMQQVGEVIDRINAFQTNIARAVDGQTSTTEEMQRQVASTAAAAGDIDAGIGAVTEAAIVTDSRAGDVKLAAADLQQLTGELGALVSSFQS